MAASGDRNAQLREVPRCNAPMLHARTADACGAPSRYVVVMTTGPVFSCKRHIAIALDARHAEAHTDKTPGMAVVWTAWQWRHADLWTSDTGPADPPEPTGPVQAPEPVGPLPAGGGAAQ